ncbi:hypothetical protein TraAM80_06250 [Trypanosoma rangeli]|uniref:Uncharacterized protein n=1 Tax=Trypanosoma rangeli TaxID=5698 RepID=A0A3R7N9E7_TRYRA|nr:uncharacterized protein TraAM80_06250 [Trypanosoma rangeli]RNF02664.1 hypothetical protein TraAM80_06250 [Trypanosoma rangeli]|eukprot:RNF02664.1 hypothetical protein TraAM80_06250 [Trypanosoma rangeli]
MAWAHLFFLVVAVLVVMGIPATATAAEDDDMISKLKGNWSILRLAGQHPQRTGFEVELSAASLVLRKEDVEQSVLVTVAESVLRLLHLLGEEDDNKWLLALPAAWRLGFPQVVNAQVTREGFHLTDCPTAGSTLLRPQYHMEAALGTLFGTPQTFYLPFDGTCTQAPFTLRGYWMEWLSKDEIIMVAMIRLGGEDRNAVFQLRRQLTEGTASQSSIASIGLLVAVALIKFLPSLYWKRKGGAPLGRNTFPTLSRPLLSEFRRRELLRRQEEIIKRMKEEDGVS